MALSTPILFLVFNRPDSTAKVFEEIRKARPKKLYIGADGPRVNKLGESEKCNLTRILIIDGIDWICEVRTLFRDQNLGCRDAVSSAISWFFEHEEEGIILEDDTLPDPSFFQYCEELLAYYRNDPSIMSISGSNLLGTWHYNKSSYFMAHGGIWGWATWRRAWRLYDINMKDWVKPETKNLIKNSIGTNEWYQYYYSMFDDSYNGKLNTWDIQWFYSILLQNGKAINPSVNLVQNIGFGTAGATHTGQNTYIANLGRNEMTFPLIHSKEHKKDLRYLNKMYSRISHQSWVERLKNLLIKIKILLK